MHNCKKRTIIVDSKIMRAFAIILVIFPWIDCQFLSSYAYINSMKPKDYDLTSIYFLKLD